MKNNCQKAAQHLFNNQIKQPIKMRLDSEIRPQTSEQALDIQAEIIKLHNHEVAGWKCLLPLDEERLIVGPIFSNDIESGEVCSLFPDNEKARLEPEIAFVLGTDLPAKNTGYTDAEIDDAIKSCHMALELIQDRFRGVNDITFYEKLADGLTNQGLFIGPELDKASVYLASDINITIDQENNKQSFKGKHPNPLPQTPLYWFINYMTKKGIDFKAGQALITGSYAGVVEVEFNQLAEIEYEGLGKYQVTFEER